MRQMYLTCLIYAFGMGDCGSYLEHPGDPANYYTKIPGHDSNPTIWIMKFFLRWVDDINRLICLKSIPMPLKIIKFSQCHYGQVCDKYTMEATDLPILHTWDGNICNHSWHPRSNEISSSKELGRYPWEMMVVHVVDEFAGDKTEQTEMDTLPVLLGRAGTFKDNGREQVAKDNVTKDDISTVKSKRNRKKK